ncbi:MAG: lytic murein transglycosylase [Kineosporiaceae bacterium]
MRLPLRRFVPRSWNRPAALVTAVALAVAMVGVRADPASAETSDQAKASAHQAALEVRRLQPQLDAALKVYAAALVRLGSDVNDTIGLTQQADLADQQVAAVQLRQVQRVRALYMSGGQAGLLASLLDSQGPSDLMERLGSLRRVLSSDTQDVQWAVDQAAALRAGAEAGDRAADASTVTAETVEADYRRVAALLAAAQDRLSRLSARARSLAEAEAAQRALDAVRAAAGAAGTAAASHATGSAIPPAFLALYRAAASTCPGLDWHVLAAIGQVESHHGRSNGPSSSGAEGPMQFLPGTFAGYAVDGNGDGVTDIWNPADSVFTAAHYLCANGAGAGSPRRLYGAIFRYNHADWYVQMVLKVAADLRTRYPS